MLEKELEAWAVRTAKMLGIFTSKFDSERANPDRMFIYKGQVFFVEFKAKGKKPRPDQKKRIELMSQHGATVYVCDTVDKIRDILLSYIP